MGQIFVINEYKKYIFVDWYINENMGQIFVTNNKKNTRQLFIIVTLNKHEKNIYHWYIK